MTHSNQFPVHKPAKKYALYAGNEVRMRDQPYPVLVYEMNRLKGMGMRFLKIKPLKQ